MVGEIGRARDWVKPVLGPVYMKVVDPMQIGELTPLGGVKK